MTIVFIFVYINLSKNLVFGSCCLRSPYKLLRKKKDAKGKGENERHTHLNAAFKRIARRDKKAFLSDHCKEREKQ